MKLSKIDHGKAFEWGRASKDYAVYRDIYPELFYQKIAAAGICTKGQRVLDLGTGTGVLPRNMYKYGADFTGTDISEQQIEEARRLSAQAGMDIVYECIPTEKIDYAEHSFDAVTACQCFFYFDHAILAKKLAGLLKENGRLAVLYMAWLPKEDPIAGKSEELVLKYNPDWSGKNEYRHVNHIPDDYNEYFEIEKEEVYDLKVPFTRESWNGRIRSCRGIGASLGDAEIAEFNREHLALLGEIAPERFEILHYAAMTILKKR